LSGSLTMDSTKQAMLSAIDMKAALMVRVAPPTWMALWCRELVHDTVVTLTGLQLEPACWCGCCTLLLPVLAAARLALSSGLLVGVFTMAAVVLAVQVCLSGARSLVGRQSSCLCSGCGDLVVWSDVASLRSWWLPLCHFVNRRFQASRSRLSFAPCPDFTVLLGWSNGL
jgi:hypothetical protein